ncbi:MAG: efflux RND transporter periplasmic adaptor subunit [Pseudohongiellaceae bacterium]
MKRQHLIAIGILVVVAVWMVIPRGASSTSETPAEADTTIIAASAERVASARSDAMPNSIVVRAERVLASAYTEQVRVRGRTRAYRHVEVRTEQPGRVIGNPVPRGARVAEGDLLCELAVDSRAAELAQASSRREKAELEYEAALDLQARDLQSDVIVAQLKAALETAGAELSRAELALEKTRIVAPFDGVVESRDVEQGDLLNVGTVCASVLDDSPMLLVGLVPEQDVGRISVGNRVNAMLVDGERISGRVVFLSRAADAISRSYRIEVEVDAGQGTIRDGITAELFVASVEAAAHLVPSSALTLDDNGEIGVKVIDANNRVRFQPVEIIGDNTGQINPGVWVKGLQGAVTLVTVGQESVFSGQIVQADFSWDDR